MAGSVEHLAVAWKLLKKWRGRQEETGIQSPALFLAGNICPDGIHSRDNYQRPMKMHTHFRDGIPDYEFTEPENLTLFHQRIRKFARDMAPVLPRELCMGYVAHVLTDEYFMRTVRPEFMKAMEPLGLNEKTEETFRYFTYDVNQINCRLAREYPEMDEVVRLLRAVSPYRIPGWLTEEELTRSRKWVLSFFFDQPWDPRPPVYLPYERTLRFLEEAAEVVGEEIFGYLP